MAFSCLLLSCPLGASRAWPLSGLPRGLLGFSGGDLRAVFKRQKPPEELQESSRGRQESPKESPGRPQGGHKEAPEAHRRAPGSSKGPWAAKTTIVMWLLGFAAPKVL